MHDGVPAGTLAVDAVGRIIKDLRFPTARLWQNQRASARSDMMRGGGV